jgi:hypothetical protein
MQAIDKFRQMASLYETFLVAAHRPQASYKLLSSAEPHTSLYETFLVAAHRPQASYLVLNPTRQANEATLLAGTRPLIASKDPRSYPNVLQP